MRLIERTGPGQLGLNYMWLPTWIGMNTQLLRELEEAISASIVGRVLDDGTLDLAHELVMDTLERKFPANVGLREYLDGIKFVVEHGRAG
jgi:hypothetical protein